MKSILLLLIIVFVGCNTPIQPSKPKLVVGIVVDQMRMDYLTRFESQFGNAGFKRFYKEGFVAKNHHFDYTQTQTGPGHASIATGSPPAIHGIISNAWFDKVSGRNQNCVSDNRYRGVGTSSKVGQKAPTQLLASAFADENRLATQMRGKTIGVSIKDRGAILAIGHTANGAYWFSGKNEGNFVSSTFYMDALPQWAADFNTSRIIDNYLTTWDTYFPIDTYIESGPDDTPYEGVLNGKETPTFPYDLKKLAGDNGGYDVLGATPFGNSLITDFALAALNGEQLGKDDDADVLMNSFSSTDYIGHKYGINAKELQDAYVRLDRDLARLFSALDNQVGKGEYAVFLTSDHGASHVSNFLIDNNIPGGYFRKSDFVRQLNEAVASRFGTLDLVRNISNNEIFLNHEGITKSKINWEQIQQFVVSFALSFHGIATAYSADNLMLQNDNNAIVQRLQRGHHPKRSGDIVFTLLPGYTSYGPTGSTHGSAYVYDTHIPLLMFGKGVRKGSTYAHTSITDIAPTISALLGVSNPTGNTGNPIVKALRKP